MRRSQVSLEQALHALFEFSGVLLLEDASAPAGEADESDVDGEGASSAPAADAVVFGGSNWIFT